MVNVLRKEKFVMVKLIVRMVQMKIQDFVVRKRSLQLGYFFLMKIILARYDCQPTEYRCLSGGCIPYVERCDRKIGKNKTRRETFLNNLFLIQIVMMVVMKIILFNHVFIRNVPKDNSLVVIFVVLIISNVATVRTLEI